MGTVSNRHLRMLLSGLSLLCVICMAISKGAARQGLDLSEYRWNKRIIVTYAPSEQHPEILKLKEEIAERSCEYNNRNLVHRHINSDEQDFKLVLIGYDGGSKMPMRRREMRND